MEKWKQVVIDGIQTQYEISDLGRCRNTNKLSWKTGGVLVPGFNKSNGYESYCIADPNLPKNRYMYAHRLVLLHFSPTEEFDSLDVNHIDCNKRNNHLTNLEWCTRKENMAHAVENELIGKPIVQYTLQGSFIQRFSSAAEAETKLDLLPRSISQALTSSLPNSQSGGFQWRFEGGGVPVLNIENNYKAGMRGLVQMTLDGRFIEEFSHSTLAYEKLGKVDNGYLSRVAKRSNNTYMGYRWMHSEDYHNEQS